MATIPIQNLWGGYVQKPLDILPNLFSKPVIKIVYDESAFRWVAYSEDVPSLRLSITKIEDLRKALNDLVPVLLKNQGTQESFQGAWRSKVPWRIEQGNLDDLYNATTAVLAHGTAVAGTGAPVTPVLANATPS